MTLDQKACLTLNQSGELLQGTAHQIRNAPASSAPDVVVVCSSMADFVPELSFLEFDLRHQAQFFEHGEGPIDGDEIRSQALRRPAVDRRRRLRENGAW